MRIVQPSDLYRAAASRYSELVAVETMQRDKEGKKMQIVKQKAIKGFLPVTYCVFDGEKLLKIFLAKKDAETFVKEQNKK